MRWWGWGDPAHAPTLGARELAFLARHDRARAGAPAPGGARTGAAGAERAARGGARSAARDRGIGRRTRRPRRTRGCTRPARATRIWCACARASPRGRPTRWCARLGTTRCARCSSCARAGIARGRAVRRRHQRGRWRGAAARRARRGDRARHAARWARCSRWTAASHTVKVQAGMRAPAFERHLAARGLTLGHFPQSFEYVSLGGCAATRSAGQASTGYGAIDKMVLGLRLAAPADDIELAAVPASAAGPGAAPAAGRLGGHAGGDHRACPARAPGAARSASTRASSSTAFAAGVEALRALAREHALPDVARLSDEPETAHVAGAGGRGRREGTAGARLPRRARLSRGLPGDRRLRGHERGGRRRGASARWRWCAAAAGCRWGARRGRRGCARASPRPTCAMSCSRTG